MKDKAISLPCCLCEFCAEDFIQVINNLTASQLTNQYHRILWQFAEGFIGLFYINQNKQVTIEALQTEFYSHDVYIHMQRFN